MLPVKVISALQAYSASGKPLIVAATDAPGHYPKFDVGQQLQALVQSKVSGGVFQVQVARQAMHMRLPDNIRSGDTIKLVVTATQPSVTFSLVASTSPLSTAEQISATARTLADLADMPLQREVIRPRGDQVILPDWQALPDTKLIVGALRAALGQSGLFYESHQAQWVRGERATAELLAEPQNQIERMQRTLSVTHQAEQANALDAPMSASSVQIKATEVSGTFGAKELFPPELLPLVRQQLHALETHQITWAGQVWPGQEMRWEIQGEPEHESRHPDERQWSTEIELSLPGLGDVHARLVLAADGLKLKLRAADAATIDLFNRALPELRYSLADAGIEMTVVAVEKS